MSEQIKHLSRRGFLRAAGLGAVAMGASTWYNVRPVLGQVSAPQAGVTAFSRFNVGSFEVTIIQDGLFPFNPSVFGANVDASELTALLAANNITTETVNNTINNILVNTGSQLVLLDAGNGALNGGQLVATLELLGIARDDINAVIFTHFHPDHINGGARNGAMTYPNATYYFPQAEWDFMESAPADSPVAGIIASARNTLQPAIDAGKMEYYGEGEIIPGFVGIPTPGHTPGHMAVMIESDGAQLLDMADSTLNHIVSVARPDWFTGFDAIPELAVETRRALLSRAAEEGLQVFGYHFAFPGIGYIVANGEGFRFVPSF